MFTYLTRLSSSRNLLYIVVKSPLKMTYQKKGLKGNSINGNLKEKGNNINRKRKITNRAQEKQYYGQSMLPQVQPVKSETKVNGLEKGILS